MKLKEKVELLPIIIQEKLSGMVDVLVHNYQTEKEVTETNILTFKLVEYILSTQNENLLLKIEKLIEQEVDSRMVPWEKQELEKTMKNFNRNECISHKEVMTSIERKYG
jgi:hypothetical protein